MPSEQFAAPGTVLEIRDETWFVRRVERASDGWFVEVQGLSELVRGTHATFSSPIDDITPLDPAMATVKVDMSAHHTESRLWLEATLRKTAVPLTDPTLTVSTQGLADALPYLEPTWLHPQSGASPYSGASARLFPWTLAKAHLSSPAALRATVTERMRKVSAGRERDALQRLLDLADANLAAGSAKYDSLTEQLRRIGISRGGRERVVIFAERVSTLHWLRDRKAACGDALLERLTRDQRAQQLTTHPDARPTYRSRSPRFTLHTGDTRCSSRSQQRRRSRRSRRRAGSGRPHHKPSTHDP
jgi:hypothetical protein